MPRNFKESGYKTGRAINEGMCTTDLSKRIQEIKQGNTNGEDFKQNTQKT